MPINTLNFLVPLQDLLFAFQSIDAESFFKWLYFGVQRLGEPVACELIVVFSRFPLRTACPAAQHRSLPLRAGSERARRSDHG